MHRRLLLVTVCLIIGGCERGCVSIQGVDISTDCDDRSQAEEARMACKVKCESTYDVASRELDSCRDRCNAVCR
jgi:hypothetical protein